MLHRQRGLRHKHRDTMSLSGWLYADLLLGLAMLFFVFNTVGVEPPAELDSPRPTPTASPTLTPTLTPTAFAEATKTPTPRPTNTPVPPNVLSPEAFEFSFRVNADRLLQGDKSEQDRVRQEIRSALNQYVGKRKAGFVLTFGTSNVLDEGTRLSREMNRLLVEVLPEVFDTSVRRDFLQFSNDRALRGQIKVEIYFFTGIPVLPTSP